MFIDFLYVFRATVCPSLGENAAPMRHLVFVTLDDYLLCRAEFRPAYQTVIYIEWQIPGFA